jgi:hypothetical protein
MSKEISNQLLRTKYYLDYSLRTQAFDRAVASLISTEMYFRGSLHRFMEYIAWIIYWLVRPNKLYGLSVGVAQIQLRHWCNLGFIRSFSPSIGHLRIITDPTANYKACKKYLLARGYSDELSSNELACLYTGSARKYYVTVLSKAIIMWDKSPNWGRDGN